VDIKLNGLTLAYIGDAYYELAIRRYLINKKLTSVNILHKKAIKFTSGVAQAKIIRYFLDKKLITDDEISFFKRGRNVSGPGRKNTDAKTYHLATGFEALIGALYLDDIVRADELIIAAITYMEEGDFDGENS